MFVLSIYVQILSAPGAFPDLCWDPCCYNNVLVFRGGVSSVMITDSLFRTSEKCLAHLLDWVSLLCYWDCLHVPGCNCRVV